LFDCRNDDKTSLVHRAADNWDKEIWAIANEIYVEAFPEHGRKSEAIIRRMFERHLCSLHAWRLQCKAVAMALTSYDERSQALILDYLAVKQTVRDRGIGRKCVEQLREWAETTYPGCLGILIEVEADDSSRNEERIRFWEKTGFRLTDYVHSYIWVPETYRAMKLSFDPEHPLSDDGKQLFKAITRYHERAYRKKD